MLPDEKNLDLFDERIVADYCQILEDFVHEKASHEDTLVAINQLEGLAGTLITEHTYALRKQIARQYKPNVYEWKVEMFSLIGKIGTSVYQKNNGTRIQAGLPIQ
tara:strand:+ start:5443 stop:5757 length:315 start_codon:yes stop_codon:yes gene_type:complete